MGIGFGVLESPVRSVQKHRNSPNRWLGSRWCINKDRGVNDYLIYQLPDRHFMTVFVFNKKWLGNMEKYICIKGVTFKRITEKSLKKTDITNMLFFMISQSGAIDRCGTVYFFTPTASFFMDKEDYTDGFINKILSYVSKWKMINVYFCDFLVINPKIYDSFVHELCIQNTRYFWFETAIEVYRDKYCK